jgi:hypothetical protein
MTNVTAPIDQRLLRDIGSSPRQVTQSSHPIRSALWRHRPARRSHGVIEEPMHGFSDVRLTGTDAVTFASSLTGCDTQFVKGDAGLETLVVRAVVFNAICEF